jgi:hypothetical protein
MGGGRDNPARADTALGQLHIRPKWALVKILWRVDVPGTVAHLILCDQQCRVPETWVDSHIV